MNKKLNELKGLFAENLELGKWANCQSLILEVAKIDVLEADTLAGDLQAAQDANEEDARGDEQLKHRESPEMDSD